MSQTTLAGCSFRASEPCLLISYLITKLHVIFNTLIDFQSVNADSSGEEAHKDTAEKK